MTKNVVSTRTGYLTALAIALPVAGYLIYAWYFSESLFFADDFHLLKSVQGGKETPGLAGKIQLLYQQHQEHRIVVPRLLTWLDYGIEGHINWKTLILVANLLWCGTVFLLWKAFLSLNISRWYFIPVPWLLLHPQYHENVTWAISILQQSDIVFLLTLLTFLAARKKYNAALCISVIATFTHGNGMLSFPIAILFALVDRDWKNAAKFLLVMLAVAAFYFSGFKAGQSASVGRSLADPVNLFASFGVFLGGITRIFHDSYTVAAAAGWVMTGVLAAWSLTSLWKKLSAPEWRPLLFDRMLWGITAFLVITATMVVITRSWQGMESVAAPRYLHYPSYMACLTYLVLLRTGTAASGKWLAILLIPAGIGICLASYLNSTPRIRFLRDQLVADESNYVNHGIFLQYFPSFNRNIAPPYAAAVANGVVRMEDRLPHAAPSADRYTGPPLEIARDSFRLEDASRTAVVPVARISSPGRTGRRIFIAAAREGQQRPFWIPVFTQRAAYRSLLASGALLGKGFEGNVITSNLPPGKYRLGVYADGRVSWTDQYLPVPF